MKKILLIVMGILFSQSLLSQHDTQRYFPESDSLVLAKIAQWQDMKFGLLMHWGPYSQWGIVESWSICPEDYPWCQRKKEGAPTTYHAYVEAYENLQNTFNPVNFDPEKWAHAAKNAGMKYLVFTTKHHDGFCMFDSRYTDYKITDPQTPFSTNKKANITQELFAAFREKGLWTGAYFSKPDWHSDDYWWSYFPPTGRNVNYDPLLYPEKWQSFVTYTHNQILELLSDYGKVDILWLDGGWVARQPQQELLKFYADKMVHMTSGFMKNTIVSQDIGMDELVEKARRKQPGLIVVDRAVEGKNQNYLTPENTVPDQPLPYPWESCIISGGGWSHTAGAQYMSGHKAIHMLVDIVCKGGNLLLNVAPGPDGSWDEGAYKLLDEIGTWMQVNGEAIYETRPIAPYKEAKIAYTQKKNTDTLYAIYLAAEGEETLPQSIQIDAFSLGEQGRISLLGSDEKLNWVKNGSGIRINIPKKLRNTPPCQYGWSFKMTHFLAH